MTPAISAIIVAILNSAFELWRIHANKPEGWKPSQSDLDGLMAEVDAEKFRANPDRHAIGTVIESQNNPQRGILATVLVHDAARCLVTSAQIDALIDACAHDGVGGLLAHKLADTLKTAIKHTLGGDPAPGASYARIINGAGRAWTAACDWYYLGNRDVTITATAGSPWIAATATPR